MPTPYSPYRAAPSGEPQPVLNLPKPSGLRNNYLNQDIQSAHPDDNEQNDTTKQLRDVPENNMDSKMQNGDIPKRTDHSAVAVDATRDIPKSARERSRSRSRSRERPEQRHEQRHERRPQDVSCYGPPRRIEDNSVLQKEGQQQKQQDSDSWLLDKIKRDFRYVVDDKQSGFDSLSTTFTALPYPHDCVLHPDQVLFCWLFTNCVSSRDPICIHLQFGTFSALSFSFSLSLSGSFGFE